MSPTVLTCSLTTNASGQWGRCVDRPHQLSQFFNSLGTSQKYVEQTIGYLTTVHPSSRKTQICSFDGINFKSFEAPFDSGTRGTNVPRFEPKTSWSSCRNIIDWDSQLGRTSIRSLPLGCQSIWFSCRRRTRSAVDESITTTSNWRSKELHAYSRLTKGISAFFLWNIVQGLPSIRELQSTSCPSGKVGMTTMGITGADRFLIQKRCMSTKERSLNPAVRPVLAAGLERLSTSLRCAHVQVAFAV